ncbi:MAG: hypothetical protein WBM44_26780 [Waterburya sp.]
MVDPDAQTILILELTGKTYTELGSFSGQGQVRSPSLEN